MSTSPILGITYLVEGQASAEVSVNDAINILEAVAFGGVKDRDLTAPPGGESNGDRYIVGALATGAWSSQDGKIAVYYDGWYFVTVAEGFELWVDDEDVKVTYDGSNWYVTNRKTRRLTLHFDDPAAGDEALALLVESAITITKLVGVISGGTNVNFDVRHHTDRSNAGNAVNSAGLTVTSTTTGTVDTSFDDATVPTNSFVWVEIDSVSGSVDWAELMIEFTVDG